MIDLTSVTNLNMYLPPPLSLQNSISIPKFLIEVHHEHVPSPSPSIHPGLVRDEPLACREAAPIRDLMQPPTAGWLQVPTSTFHPAQGKCRYGMT